MNANQIWQTTLEQLHPKIDQARFTTWLQGSVGLFLDENELVIGAPTPFARDHLEVHFSEQVRTILTDILGSPRSVRFIVLQKVAGKDEVAADAPLPSEPPPAHKRLASKNHRPGSLRQIKMQEVVSANSVFPAPSRPVAHRSPSGSSAKNSVAAPQVVQPGLFFASESMLNPRYTFGSFIMGKSNQLAHAASLAVAENPGHVYNPLFLYGGVGLGKTHLMHAIGHMGEASGLNVLYVTSEKFTNEIINAIRFQKTEEFRAKYRQIDILLVDDIQFIAGKESTEEEFFHTFNSLHSANKQIVVTSDRPPKAISSLQDRLRSRFEWGLLADIQPPEYEHRLAILRSKADSLRFAVPTSVIEYVARPECSNVRELEGALNRVIAYATLHDAALSVELAMQALENVYGNAVTRPAPSQGMLTANAVLQGVCRYYNVGVERMLGKQRDREIVWPRQVAMYLMREETDASLLQIGMTLGGRDHTTIIYGYEKVRSEMKHNERVRQEIADVLNSLRSDS
ncbi:MAG TPA: chromosomal replication initiator protein DnaA [Ktedonobacteraceae bacterium]|nr:chromosomal replication initiator protein DnaA [Ktedonobacteraceae bacterium]